MVSDGDAAGTTLAARLRRRLPARLQAPSPWWFAPPLALGALLLAATLLLAPGTARDQAAAPPLPVRYMTAEPTDVVPVYVGYGRVQPRQSWQAVSQVPGAISWRHPELRAGARFGAGEPLLKVDNDDYQAALEEAESRVHSAEAAVAELQARAADLDQSLAIERQALQIAETDYARNVELADAGHISRTRLGQEEQALLRQRQTVQNLTAQINLLPAQRQAAEARLRETRAAASRADRDLARTEVVMPFAGRIVDVAVERGQFVPLGQTMLEAEDTGDMEVRLEVSYELLRSRFPALLDGPADQPRQRFPALIRATTGQTWSGHVGRVDPGLNRANRAAQLYLKVDHGAAPAPAANLYVEAEIQGPALPARIVVPRLAVRDGHVLLASDDDTLTRRRVEVEFVQQDSAIIRTGLAAGARIIVTDVLYPAEGMALAPQPVEPAAGGPST